MPVSLVGKYVLVFSTPTGIIPNSSSERASFDSPFYLIEKAAELSGAWSYVPCARNDLSSPWAMLVPNSTTDRFSIMPVVEWYYRNESGTIFLDCSHYYNGPLFQQKNDVLNAQSRTELEGSSFNLIRKNSSRDLCTVTGTTNDCTRLGFAYQFGVYFAYVGPDVVMFGNQTFIAGQTHPYYNVHIINFYRQGTYGGYAARTFCFIGAIGTFSGFRPYFVDSLSQSVRITSSACVVPSAQYWNLNSQQINFHDYLGTPYPYLYLMNNTGSNYLAEMFKLEWLLIASVSSPFVFIKYDNKVFYKLFVDTTMFHGSSDVNSSASACVYVRVDEVYSRETKIYP